MPGAPADHGDVAEAALVNITCRRARCRDRRRAAEQVPGCSCAVSMPRSSNFPHRCRRDAPGCGEEPGLSVSRLSVCVARAARPGPASVGGQGGGQVDGQHRTGQGIQRGGSRRLPLGRAARACCPAMRSMARSCAHVLTSRRHEPATPGHRGRDAERRASSACGSPSRITSTAPAGDAADGSPHRRRIAAVVARCP